MKKNVLVLLVVVCLVASGAMASPYLGWTAGMSSAQSSDLGGYPASNVFDSTYTAGGWRGDWVYATGTAQGDAGFTLRDDFHGNWHSAASGSYTSPSGVACQEWLAADFGSLQTIAGADIWNINWDVINATRAVKNMSIDVSTDGIVWTTVWSGDLSMAPGNRPDLMYDGVTYIHPDVPETVQYGLLATDSVSFGGPVNAQYVSLNMQSNWGNDAYMSLEEVRFVVPEPATMTLLGLGAVALLRKRKV